MVIDNERISGLIDHAIGDLREFGWTQGLLRDEYGKMCLLGALSNQQYRWYSSSEILKARWAVASVIKATDCYLGIAAWNDTDGRTADEVIGILEKARAYAAEHVDE